MCQFDELKILVGHACHNERLAASIIHRAVERRKTDLWMEGEAKQKQRSTIVRRRKKHRLGEEGANEDMEDIVMDMMSQVPLKLTVQLQSCLRDMKAATYGTLFPPRPSAIVAEMPSAGRVYNDLVTTKPNTERGSPHIWFFLAGAEDDSRKNQQPQEVLAWVKACRHLFDVWRVWRRTEVGNDFCYRWVHFVEEAGGRERPVVSHLPLTEVMATTQEDSSHKRRMHTQDPIMARRSSLWMHARFRAGLRVEPWQDSCSVRFRSQRKRKERERCG